jgi:hypothetical protein
MRRASGPKKQNVPYFQPACNPTRQRGIREASFADASGDESLGLQWTIGMIGPAFPDFPHNPNQIAGKWDAGRLRCEGLLTVPFRGD